MSLVAENARGASDLWADRFQNDRTYARIFIAVNFATIALTLYVVLGTWYLFLHSRGYIDYCEGLVLFHQTRAAAGENVFDVRFREAPMYSLPMYGPVFYYMLAPVVAVYPSLLPGRVVSALSLAAMSVLTWRLLRRRFGATRMVAALAALPWLALLGPQYFGVNNRVDSFSVFLGVSALFAAYSRRPNVWLAAIPLLLLAGFTRTTAAVAPGTAIFLAFLCERRFKDAAILSASVVLSAAAVILAGDYLSHGNFSQCLIFTNGSVPLKMTYLKNITGTVCKQLLLPVGVTAALFLLRDRGTRLFGLHALLSFALATVTSAKIGSHVNYFIEPSWSACLALGLALTMVRKPALLRLGALAACALVIQSGVRAESRMRGFYKEMNNFPRLLDLVRTYGAKGPILTMESGAQVLAGQQVYVADMHIFTRLNELGKFDLTPILNDLRHRRLAAVIAHDDIKPGYTGHTNWTPEMRQAVAAYYRPVEEYSGLTAYVPRQTPLTEEVLDAAGRMKQVVQMTFYASGRKATAVTLVDGLKDGIEREWDEQGHLRRETTFVEGCQTGPEIRWLENGNIASRTEYLRGARIGTEITWHASAPKWTEAHYVHGVLQEAHYDGGFSPGEIARWDENE